MRQLVLLRHAKSSWDDPVLADHDRPLAPRGRRALRRLRDHLAKTGPGPDLVLCSSARRAVETLDGVRPALRSETPVEIEAQLYGADASELLARLRRVDADLGCVLLIGHNPGMADLAELLVGDSDPASLDQMAAFPTAALATLSLEPPWQDLRARVATLEAFWTPRHSK